MLLLIFFASVTYAIHPSHTDSTSHIPPSHLVCDSLSIAMSLLLAHSFLLPFWQFLMPLVSVSCDPSHALQPRELSSSPPRFKTFLSKLPPQPEPSGTAQLNFPLPSCIYTLQEDYLLPPNVWLSLCASQPLSFCSCHSFLLWAPTINSIYLIAFMIIHVFQKLECVCYFCY